jgi:hypothetical protein
MPDKDYPTWESLWPEVEKVFCRESIVDESLFWW